MSRGPADPATTGAVLVVGGGIAGMQASLDLADQGYRVVLVETKSAIGGHMAQLDKTFPTNDCAMCTISPKLIETGRHLNIDILTDTEVVKLEGEPGDFTVTLRRKPRYIDVSKCVGCGDCASVCPVSLPDLFNQGLSLRRAAYRLYPQAVPIAYAIEKTGIAPCRDACPAGQRAQGYIALIAEGRYKEAFRVIKEDNPFPSVCGRTCHHPCEGHCTRALVDEPVAIMSLKRFVVDYTLAYGREKVKPAPRTRPEWVAVVGAGPAGLTTAHDLAKLGYGVTVFEALPVAGGMMRVGIPAHRLPKGVLQQDIDDILALGVVLKTSTPIRDPVSLLGQGYNAVCLATGIASRDHSLGLEGEDSQGVIPAATFLRKVNMGEPVTVGRRVAVLGGGITALDAAAVARRLGADEVNLVLDRPRGEIPAYHWEVAAVESEGIRLLERTTATRILADEGKVGGVELARTGKGMTIDAAGRRRPVIEAGSEFTLQVDTVIATSGQQSDLTFLDPRFEDLSGDAKTLAASIPGLFVVGGRKTGAAYIVEAVALGHRAAISIDRFLRAQPLEDPTTAAIPVAKMSRQQAVEMLDHRGLPHQPRQEAALLPMEERVTSFREVVLGLTERQARAEAQRCLACGACSECLACSYACGANAIDHAMRERVEQMRVGAVILAPGYQVYQSEQAQELGLGRYPNVITALQLERLLNASGPTMGQVRRPSDGQLPGRVAFLQCVGSRDQTHDYCSSVCCLYATKQAILLKEHHPGTDVQVFLMDMRAFSKGYESYYRRARDEHGVIYTRCRISQVREDPETGNLILRWKQDDRPDLIESGFELIVLSVGMEIAEPVRQLGRDLGIELDAHGFCQTSPFAPLETSRPGIFVAGPFREPKDIPESVVDASGAAGLAGGLLSAARGSLARQASYPVERDVSGEPPRIGVFVCHCGSNIAGVVDVEAVSAHAGQLPDVVHADHLVYACSQDSIAAIGQRISEHGLNRVVIASCTPLTHLSLFADCLRQSGLNPHLVAMANIRNQCSWVHSDQPEVATAKARELVTMAVARVRNLQPLRRQSMPIHSAALVIGGGPAGMACGLALADQGFPVHLIERQAALGGNLRFLHWVASSQGQLLDTHDFLDRTISRVSHHPRISLHLESELVETTGFVGNFTSTIRKADGTSASIDHGVTVVASGGQEYRGPEHGYGSHANILTQQEFEARLAEADQEPAALSSVDRVVMILCVGPGQQSCTRICCIVALKNALRLKSLKPSAEVVVLFRDMRAYGFKERLYQEALRRGVIFVRHSDDKPPHVRADAELLEVEAYDRALARPLTFQPDLVVLSMPMIPAEGSRDLASKLRVPVDLDGWFLEAHVKLRPVDFTSDGIFLAGAAHYPKLLDESLAQAQAAASRAATILARDSLEVGGAIAKVDTAACVGCLTCVRVCPFSVPQIRTDLVGQGGLPGAAYIEEALCRGCGVCVGECPARAIELLHYTHPQLEQQVFALFDPEGPPAVVP